MLVAAGIHQLAAQAARLRRPLALPVPLPLACQSPSHFLGVSRPDTRQMWWAVEVAVQRGGWRQVWAAIAWQRRHGVPGCTDPMASGLAGGRWPRPSLVSRPSLMSRIGLALEQLVEINLILRRRQRFACVRRQRILGLGAQPVTPLRRLLRLVIRFVRRLVGGLRW